ncbi:hypothetical protein ACH5RR_032535 [Cinchona calisaya]|uniref:Uncharacterized protein n=1 Tax=Cinchona calisaya TaxID=153742 RepID=A0ABD2YNL8_9GENT
MAKPHVNGLLGNDRMVHYPLSLRTLVWTKPPKHAAKLNVHGSSIGNPSLTSCGWGLHDSKGNRILGFSKHLDNETKFGSAGIWFTMCSGNVQSYRFSTDNHRR